MRAQIAASGWPESIAQRRGAARGRPAERCNHCGGAHAARGAGRLALSRQPCVRGRPGRA
eukprot:3714074-Prymnesium_polylepis.1